MFGECGTGKNKEWVIDTKNCTHAYKMVDSTKMIQIYGDFNTKQKQTDWCYL